MKNWKMEIEVEFGRKRSKQWVESWLQNAMEHLHDTFNDDGSVKAIYYGSKVEPREPNLR
jgi:hypothetical protein